MSNRDPVFDNSFQTGSELELEEPLSQGEGIESTSQHAKVASIPELASNLQLAESELGIEDDLLEASLEEYQSYLSRLDAARAHLDALLCDTADTLDLLSEISDGFKTVGSQTAAFHQQSEGLVAEQKHGEVVADGIRNNLLYYEPLERIQKRLNAPGARNIVRGHDFSEMLLQLDECIDYMQTHPEQKEADTYRSRYRLLLTRALTLARTQFVGSVRETSAEVAKRIADKQLNDTTMSALLYAKFRVDAAEMKQVGLEIQKRANPPADAEPGTEGEYQSLMDELHTSFSASRGRLIIPLVRTKLADIAQTPSTSKDLVAFARSSISYLRGVCLDEFELWGEWFHGQRGLYDLLESICEPLYDHLRPRIIHEAKLAKLCQFCILLQTRYMNDGEDESEPLDPNELDFSHLIQSALEDTQSRIVFRTQAMLRDDIESFKPVAGDLDYPALLRSTKVPTSGRKSSQLRTSILESSEDVEAPIERWPLSSTTGSNLSSPYPTLTRAISLLSLIYRLLNPAIFDDLAHRIVHATTLSLVHASKLLKSQKKSQSGNVGHTSHSSFDVTANSHLFLLTHFLLLKSQIVAFDIEFSPQPEVSFDFSNLTNTFYELQAERGGLFNPVNLVRFVGRGRDLLPRVVENMLDAKVELDGMLRKAISDLTSWESDKMTKPLGAKGVEEEEEKARKAVAEMRTTVEKEVPLLRSRLEEWITDERTRETLVIAIRDPVMQRYEDFLDSIETRKGSNRKGKGKLKGKGKGREDEIWDIVSFGEWMEGIFGVAGEADDFNGESRSLSRNGSV